MKRTLTCIICPRGCTLQADISGDWVTISGNACPKGREYGIGEISRPVRSVTSSVRVSNRADTMLSVKTASPIPKDKIFHVMDLIRSAQVSAPVSAGTKILRRVCGTDIIATSDID